MTRQLRLKVIAGDHFGEEFVFKTHGAYIIGRSKHCALQIPNDQDMRISRQHVLLLFESEKTRVRDLGSKNGTLVNEKPLPPGAITENPTIETPQDKELKKGDKVTIGNTVFLVGLPTEVELKPVAMAEQKGQAIPPPVGAKPEPKNIPTPSPAPTPLMKNIVQPSPVPPAILEGEPTTEMSIPTNPSQKTEGDSEETPTLPIRTLPPMDRKKTPILLKRKIEKKQEPIPHPPIPNKEHPDFHIRQKEVLNIKEKQPPVPVPTNLKLQPPKQKRKTTFTVKPAGK